MARVAAKSTKNRRRRMTCTLRSTECYVQNPLAEETKIAIAKGPSPATKKDRTFDDRAAIKVFVLPDGRPCMPHAHLFGSLVNSGTQVKNGTALITVVSANRQKDFRGGYHFKLLGRAFPMVDSGDLAQAAKWYTYLMDPPNKQGQRVPEPCPLFERWQIDIVVEFDETGMSEDTVKNWVTKTGQGSGVGAARVGRGAALGFGTFDVVEGSWRDLNDDDEAKSLIVWEKPIHNARLAHLSLAHPYEPPDLGEVVVEDGEVDAGVASGNGRKRISARAQELAESLD